jgi:hypothetical protein
VVNRQGVKGRVVGGRGWRRIDQVAMDETKWEYPAGVVYLWSCVIRRTLKY